MQIISPSYTSNTKQIEKSPNKSNLNFGANLTISNGEAIQNMSPSLLKKLDPLFLYTVKKRDGGELLIEGIDEHRVKLVYTNPKLKEPTVKEPCSTDNSIIDTFKNFVDTVTAPFIKN